MSVRLEDRPHRHWLLGDLPALQRSPHRTSAAVARAGAGSGWLRLGPRRWLVVSDPAQIREVLVTQAASFGRAFQTRNIARVLGQGVLTNEGKAWSSRRRHIASALYGPALDNMTARTEVAAAQMLERLDTAAAAGAPVSPSEVTALVAQSVIADTLFGQAFSDAVAARLVQMVRDAAVAVRTCNIALLQLPQWLPIARHRQIAAIRHAFDAEVAGAIAAAAPGALVTTIAALKDPDSGAPISASNLIDEIKTLLVAGFETTSSALAWSLLLLGADPEAQALLYDAVASDDPEPVVRAIVQESLRLYPPIYAIPREVRAPVTIGGHPLRVGQVVLVSVFGAHRDPALWAEPDCFRPQRFLGTDWPRAAWLPFGGGARSCLGAEFAITELTRLLILLGRRYRFSADRAAIANPAAERAFISLTPAPEVLLHVERRP